MGACLRIFYLFILILAILAFTGCGATSDSIGKYLLKMAVGTEEEKKEQEKRDAAQPEKSFFSQMNSLDSQNILTIMGIVQDEETGLIKELNVKLPNESIIDIGKYFLEEGAAIFSLSFPEGATYTIEKVDGKLTLVFDGRVPRAELGIQLKGKKYFGNLIVGEEYSFIVTDGYTLIKIEGKHFFEER